MESHAITARVLDALGFSRVNVRGNDITFRLVTKHSMWGDESIDVVFTWELSTFVFCKGLNEMDDSVLFPHISTVEDLQTLCRFLYGVRLEGMAERLRLDRE